MGFFILVSLCWLTPLSDLPFLGGVSWRQMVGFHIGGLVGFNLVFQWFMKNILRVFCCFL
jgi:hypothetical protein